MLCIIRFTAAGFGIEILYIPAALSTDAVNQLTATLTYSVKTKGLSHIQAVICETPAVLIRIVFAVVDMPVHTGIA